jgi:hypothetical protein
LEKTNHEATPKHQGNLKRFLRDLHRGHEKDEKDKERAKAEVARLNGISTGGEASSSSSSGFGRGPTPSIPKPQATASQKKQQLAQLAEMGISIPDEFRPDMAMAGEWEVTSQRLVGDDEGEKKPEALALGVRKRAPDEEEAEEIEAKKARWGSRYRTHPTEEEDGDLDALLSSATQKGKTVAVTLEVIEKVEQEGEEIKKEPGVEGTEIPVDVRPIDKPDVPEVKSEPLDGEVALAASIAGETREEGEKPSVAVVFKKRKAKNIRQK